MKRIIACFALGFLITFLAITSPFMIQGYRLAGHADNHGIELRAGHGTVMVANQRALRGDMKFDMKEYERLGGQDLCGRTPWGVGRLFVGWGTSIYHLVHQGATRNL